LGRGSAPPLQHEQHVEHTRGAHPQSLRRT
jgi:hypothetical protein